VVWTKGNNREIIYFWEYEYRRRNREVREREKRTVKVEKERVKRMMRGSKGG
jgi:hypothetical protein